MNRHLRLYQLTDEDSIIGTTTAGVIHAYLSPELAILMNPIHRAFADPFLWEVEGDVVHNDLDLKLTCNSLTVIRQLPTPVFNIDQHVAFGIRCAVEVYDEPSFKTWTGQWLHNPDRRWTAPLVRITGTGAAVEAAQAAIAAATRASMGRASLCGYNVTYEYRLGTASAARAAELAATVANVKGIPINLVNLAKLATEKL